MWTRAYHFTIVISKSSHVLLELGPLFARCGSLFPTYIHSSTLRPACLRLVFSQNHDRRLMRPGRCLQRKRRNLSTVERFPLYASDVEYVAF